MSVKSHMHMPMQFKVNSHSSTHLHISEKNAKLLRSGISEPLLYTWQFEIIVSSVCFYIANKLLGLEYLAGLVKLS